MTEVKWDELIKELRNLRRAVSPGGDHRVPEGGYVSSLTEAGIHIGYGLYAISRSLDHLADVIANREDHQ